MNLDGRKTNKYDIRVVRPAVADRSARETALTSCGIPSRVIGNQATPGAYPWYLYVHSKKRNQRKKRNIKREQKEDRKEKDIHEKK